ncbi:hypothetical protein Tsubulata_011151, partial [Turnera subulata]
PVSSCSSYSNNITINTTLLDHSIFSNLALSHHHPFISFLILPATIAATVLWTYRRPHESSRKRELLFRCKGADNLKVEPANGFLEDYSN